jgi:arginase family enzyme
LLLPAPPLVLADSCDTARGVLAAINACERDLVWIDAHAEFNTPEPSLVASGPRMMLGVVRTPR